ncbi:MAG: dTMP kinase [Planctomycetes bacterium]|nr:dTMP kinase [Planctomycetota bacterium]
MKDNFAGRFIVLDGPDGCGKSTQTDRLCRWLKGQGATAATFRDPGATAVGEKIREILLDPVHESMGADVEVLLYMAARAQLWKEKIGPALERGECVVMDRWISSTCAYQGCAGGFGVEKVIRLGGDCLERVWPDVTIILDVDPDTAKGRMDRELDRMEQKGADYHRRVREGFLELARTVDSVVKVDATDSIEAVHENIISVVAGLIGSEGRK